MNLDIDESPKHKLAASIHQKSYWTPINPFPQNLTALATPEPNTIISEAWYGFPCAINRE
ncbi:MAG: hypothetical protein HOJ51_01335 [Tateyamaria sp.]|nr:hypothetical protein [Tateyamaria sp.]MDG1420257.1 hypothetical protein [Tateyamaria sp.]MDG2378193.1 hypothetical protein [Tateyamaria sp.]